MGNTSFTFPEGNIDPRKKLEKPWLKQYAEAAMASYASLPDGTLGWRNHNKYDEWSLYARGSQPVTKYKLTFNNGEDGENKLLVNDWRILPIIPKLLTISNGRLSELTFKPQINPIDDIAKDELESELLENEAKIALNEQLMAQGADPDLLKTNGIRFESGEAQDMDELFVRELGSRHQTALELEQVTEAVLNANNFDSLMSQWNLDMLKYGLCVRRASILNDSFISATREDPRNLVMSYCQNQDFSDWRYIGVVRSIPVSQLVATSNGALTKEEVEEMYELGCSGAQNFGLIGYTWSSNFAEFWNKGSVFVLEIQIRSSDKKVLEIRKTKTGNPAYNYTNPEGDRSGKNEYSEAYEENIYCCTWVIGTDVVYNICKLRNTLRSEFNPSKVEPSIRVYGCDVWNMMTKSRVDEIIAYADAIQYAFYRLQHHLNSMVPAGYAINFDAIEAVDLGAGGQRWTPKDILDLFFDRGILVHRSMGLGTDARALPPPIVPVSNNSGASLVEYWNMINNNIQMMKETLGLNDLTDGSTPNPKMLTEIAKAAQLGTNNAFSDIYSNQRRIVKDLTLDVVRFSQYLVKDGNTSFLSYTLGPGSMKRMSKIKDIEKYLYSVDIIENPTPEELQSLQEQIKIGQQSGQIYIDDVFMLDNMTNVKQKQAFLIARVKKNKQQQQQSELAKIQQNNQGQIQIAQSAEEAKQQTLKMQYELEAQTKLAIIAAQAKADLDVEQVRLEGKRIDAEGRLSSAEVQALGRDVNNKRDNAVKLATSENKGGEKIAVKEIISDFGNPIENYDSPATPQTANEQPLELQEFDFTAQPNTN